MQRISLWIILILTTVPLFAQPTADNMTYKSRIRQTYLLPAEFPQTDGVVVVNGIFYTASQAEWNDVTPVLRISRYSRETAWNPMLEDSFDEIDMGSGIMHHDGDYLYTAGLIDEFTSYIFKTNISDPLAVINPVQSSNSFDHRIDDMVTNGDFAYAVSSQSGLATQNTFAVIDNSGDAMSFLSFNDAYGRISGIDTDGSFLYLANEQSGMRVLDVSATPANPIEVALLATGGRTYDVVVESSLAYIADGNDGMKVIDISVPGNPTIVGQLGNLGDVRRIVKSGNLVFIGGENRMVTAINISDPNNPVEVGHHDLPDPIRAMDVEGETVYVATESSVGIMTYDAASGPMLSIDNPLLSQFCQLTSKYIQTRDIDIVNAGDADLIVTDIRGSQTYIEIDTTFFTLSPGSDQNINVSFHYLHPPEETDFLEIVHNGPSSPDTIQMSGCLDASTAVIEPDTVDFGMVDVSRKKQLELTVTNPGINFGGYLIGRITTEDSTFIGPVDIFRASSNDSTTALITFIPEAAGQVSSQLFFEHNAGPDPIVIEVSGEGTVPFINFSNDPLDFGEVTLSTGKQQSVVLTNTLPSPVVFSEIGSDLNGINVSPPNFTITANGSQVITVDFDPDIAGQLEGVLSFTTDLTGTQPSLPFLANAILPTAAFSPDTLELGEMLLGTAVDTMVSLSMLTGSQVTIDSVITSDSALTIFPQQFVLTPAADQVLDLSYHSLTPDTQTIDLTFYTNFAGGEYTLSVKVDGLENNSRSVAFLGALRSSGYASGVEVGEEYTYVAEQADGLRIYDDEGQPIRFTESGWYSTLANARKVAMYGDHAIVAEGDVGMEVVNVATPEAPFFSGIFGDNSVVYDVAVRGKYAYLATGEAGLKIVDISEPSNPTLVVQYNTFGTTYGVHVQDSVAYLADGLDGLRMIDVTFPALPSELGSIFTSDSARSVAVQGNRAYLALGNGGLQVVDIANRANPRLLGHIDTPGFAAAVAVAGRVAYVADQHRGLRVINVNSSNNPFELGYYDTPGSAEDVFLVGDTAYVADGETGVYVLQYDPTVAIEEPQPSIPQTIVLQQNYPNPFNPTTVIQYQLPTVADVNLTVYTITGQKVRTLVNTRQIAGEHRLTWDARNDGGFRVGSGVYIYRLVAGQEVQAKKMILLR